MSSEERTILPRRKPSILCLHRNGKGQFQFLGDWLEKQGWDVKYALHASTHFEDEEEAKDPNILRFYTAEAATDPKKSLHTIQYAVENALGAAELFDRLLRQEGYYPDVVIAHIGWGVGLTVKQVWPKTVYVTFHEWFYTHINWGDEPKIERPAAVAQIMGDCVNNLPIIAEFAYADANWSPTEFQRSRFPKPLRKMIEVIPDGVDMERHKPDPEAKIDFDWLDLRHEKNILTYATRGMEPLRGFPQFLRGLKKLQERRDDFHTVILANDEVAYGAKLPENDSWRLRMISELDLDLGKVHIFGMREREEYQRVIQASSAHIYFTEPFVTSWSLSESLASGALVIGSNTAPVQELIEDMENGILVDMDDPDEIADMIEWAFDHPEEAARIRKAAHEFALREYEGQKIFAMKEAKLKALIAEKRGEAALLSPAAVPPTA